MHHDTTFDWMSDNQATFISLKGAQLQAPLLYYPDPLKEYIVYRDATDDACGTQLPQDNHDQELSVSFLSHTFMDTQ